MVAILKSKAKVDRQISRVVPHLVDDGLLILQYPDDTIIFMELGIRKMHRGLKIVTGRRWKTDFKRNSVESLCVEFTESYQYNLASRVPLWWIAGPKHR
jgi:hypothetical protein